MTSIASRLKRAVPLGLLLAALTLMVAMWGVHAYQAPRLQWLLLFPAALFGLAALPVHALVWIAYAFVAVSAAARSPERRRYRLALAAIVAGHLVIGLATARAV